MKSSAVREDRAESEVVPVPGSKSSNQVLEETSIMKNHRNLLVTIFACCIFAVACSSKTSEPANSNGPASSPATKNAEATKNVLKPGDVSPDRAIKVSELVDSVAADKDAWKGKDVAVTGYVLGTSGSETHLLLTMTDEQTAANKREISCALQGVKSADVFTKTIEVKGKISSSNLDAEFKSVNLEPCELKK